MNRLMGVLTTLTTVVLIAVPGAVATADEPAVPGEPAVPVAAGTLLPFSGSSPGDVVVDEPHGHVFVSGGEGEVGVAVLDLDGALLQTLAVPDAEGMLLSGDGATLYVALGHGEGIAAVDASTLDATTFPTSGHCPRRLTEAAAAVYFTESCDGEAYQLMRLEPGTGTVAEVAVTGSSDTVLDRGGPIASSPTEPTRLYSVDNSFYSGAYATVRAFDLDPGDGLTAAYSGWAGAIGRAPYEQVSDVTVSDDGQQLVVAGPTAVTLLATTDLTRTGIVYAYGDGPVAVTTAGGYHVDAGDSSDGRTSRIQVLTPSGEEARTYWFDGPTRFRPGSLAFASDRLFAVAWHPDSGSVRLHVFADFATPGPDLTLAGPMATDAGAPVHRDGSATLLGEPFPGHDIELWRSGPDGLVSLGTVVTGDDGSFPLDDTPPSYGGYTYVALHRGEPGVAPAKSSAAHNVRRLDTSLGLDLPPVFHPGEPVVLHGSLIATKSKTPLAGTTVAVRSSFGGVATEHDPVVTDDQGEFAVEVANQGVGTYDVQVDYAGDATTYAPDSFARPAVVKHRVTLDLPAPAPFVVNDDGVVTFTGTLRSEDGQVLSGQTVRWQRYNPGATSSSRQGDKTVGADGSFTFGDSYLKMGLTRWQVSYRGDATHDVAATDVVVPVYLHRASVSITPDRTSYAAGSDASLQVSVHGSTTGTEQVYARPYGGERTLVGEAAGAVSPFPVQRNTTVTAVFEPYDGNYNYAPNQGSTGLAVHPVLSQRLLRSYARDGRAYLVHRSRDPRLTVAVSPALPGRCVRVRVQRYRDGAYQAAGYSGCIALDSSSRAGWTLTGTPPAGARFRLRYEAPGDAAFSGTTAGWAYVRFTK